MKSVFIIQHSYDFGECDETKMIGVYSSLVEAEKAVERSKKLEGFKDRPNDFHIDEYELNQDYWTEGYATMTGIMVPDINGEWKAVPAKCLADGTYEIYESYENDLLENLNIWMWWFVRKQMTKCMP